MESVIHPQEWRTYVRSHSGHCSGGQWRPSAVLIPILLKLMNIYLVPTEQGLQGRDVNDNSTKRQPMQNQNPYWFSVLVSISDYKS